MKPEELDPDDLIGAVRYENRWRFFGGTTAEWILDYARYDPGFDSSRSDFVFRGGLLVVSPQDAAQFCAAMAPYELSLSDVERLVALEGPANWPLSIVVDFDAQTYVNGFYDLPLHEYVPEGWNSYEGDPLNYVPHDIAGIWRGKQDSSGSHTT